MDKSWHDTILYAQNHPNYERLIHDSYLEKNLKENVQRFESSKEFLETTKLLFGILPKAKTLLDVGSGNGISAIAFARMGMSVTALEPDKSDMVGHEAIQSLIDQLGITNCKISPSYMETNQLASSQFDVIYARQAMHHAANLNSFIEQSFRLLKPGGVLFTVRDHVVFNKKDKKRFLLSHPLHKYYGGENAFSAMEYKHAFESNGFQIKREITLFDSVINYFPRTKEEMENRFSALAESRKTALKRRLGGLSNLKAIQTLYDLYLDFRFGKISGEQAFPGRMYSYICLKPNS